MVTKREREDRAARAKQTAHLKDLQPIMMTTHLPSIKIFYNTVQVTSPSSIAEHWKIKSWWNQLSSQLEEYSPDGQVIGEIDQGDSSADEVEEGGADTAEGEGEEAAGAPVEKEATGELLQTILKETKWFCLTNCVWNKWGFFSR